MSENCSNKLVQLLPLGVPHPAAVSAHKYITNLGEDKLKEYERFFADIDEQYVDKLSASVCLSTIRRLLNNQSVGDRFILGLAWTIIDNPFYDMHSKRGRFDYPSIEIFHFSTDKPTYGDFVAFVCPIQKDRWEIGWMDEYKLRIEGGESFKTEDLSFWFLLPPVPDTGQ